jgi:hypothetical protein
VLRWFPDRFCVARRDRLSLISKLHPDANLFGPPPPYTGKTFSDSLTAIRGWLWRGWVFPQAGGGTAVEELPEPPAEILFVALAPAA